MPVITWDYEDEDGEPEQVVFPAKYEVCERCQGSGVHDHPAFSNGLSSEDLSDPDFREAYFGGRYDVQCEECKGERVVPVLDYDAIERNPKLKDKLKLYQEHLKFEYEYERECEMERRMGL